MKDMKRMKNGEHREMRHSLFMPFIIFMVKH
jgi:hypothetical protein